ncbi:Hpt domain-containing protein [Plebeiibacterium marinum]|uniref:Hpt domain-containing protein n=1 Tax=Plebeiibacterium marinum TaxID=2992111 RepID=A0AAE3MCE8_9BACT|nr:Hpt domain-containing protein [Plebeiobacterium marinum]MCW3804886.1 Hpt domain-containing protein [Plebeiobacterium marinum]
MEEKYKYVDLSYLEGIADGDKSIVKELVEIFLDQMPEFTDGFDESLKDKNWLKIAAIAHKAKSSVVSMGMNDLGNNDLKNLELLAKQLRVIELKRKDSVTEAQKDEIIVLEKNFEGYPEDRIKWVRANANLSELENLIEKFNDICEKAKEELDHVVSTY